MPAAAPPPVVTVRVPAKVNLQLGVGGLRPDGFHELVTVFHAVDLYDQITVRPARRLSVRMSGEGAADLPAGRGNLAWQAAKLLATRAGVKAGVAIEIDKAIPVAGGMAGGSADAAGTLVACAELWGLDREALPELAVELGSDVAFGLLGGTAIGTGRGEQLEPITTSGELHWVFALADFGISAGDAYRELDRLRASRSMPPPTLGTDGLRSALASGEPWQVAAELSNDLQPASLSLAPLLHDVLDAGVVGALAAIVSGSGPTCAFLCVDGAAATALADSFTADGVCRTARTASGPVAGAAVVS